MKDILGQLARSGLLLPDVGAAILAGNAPPLEQITQALLILCLDAHALILADPLASLTQKRLTKMSLAVAFLAGLSILSPPADLTTS